MAAYTMKTISADGIDIFYREAGPQTPTTPTILLLHGFPSSSHQYRNLIPILDQESSQKYRIIAPDLPGYGFTTVPESRNYTYTFENIATTIEAFLDVLAVTKFSIYVFDYGAPTGYRLALRRPDAIQAIITQNGNAYEEGFSAFWDPLRALWSSGSQADREVLRAGALSFDAVKWQYTHGTDASKVAPEAYHLDHALMQRPGNQDIQLDLFYDYRMNVELYPKFHEYFRTSNVPVLAVWGKNDNIFIPAGAEAFKRDADVEVKYVDGGHFAVESHGKEIAALMLDFLKRKGI
ncbi:Alpha/Beta hydrolase protein [Tricladium varicosporioides]|nr:Alpha/Beta hydrolase protein [Hymenoscyphus varicosporioides]